MIHTNKDGIENAWPIRWWLDIPVLINGLNGWRNNDGVQFFLEKKEMVKVKEVVENNKSSVVHARMLSSFCGV